MTMIDTEIELIKFYRTLFGKSGIGSARLWGAQLDSVEVEIASLLFASNGTVAVDTLKHLVNVNLEEIESTLTKLSVAYLVINGPNIEMNVSIVSSFKISESRIQIQFDSKYLEAIKHIFKSE